MSLCWWLITHSLLLLSVMRVSEKYTTEESVDVGIKQEM